MMLLMFAWSAVVLNLNKTVYIAPIMYGLFGAEPAEPNLPKLDLPRTELPIPTRDAYLNGQQLMAVEAERRGFKIYGERVLDYDPEHGTYIYPRTR